MKMILKERFRVLCQKVIYANKAAAMARKNSLGLRFVI